MQILKINSYEHDNGYYAQDGIPKTNFTLAVKKIILTETNGVNYQFHVNTNEAVYIITVTSSQINRERFLKEVPIIIQEEDKFYGYLRGTMLKKIFFKNEILYQTNRNGLQMINGNWLYVYTNGSIGKDGFCNQVYSGVEATYFPDDADIDIEKNKVIIEKLFNEYNCNPKVFYLLFLLNLMSITNGYFRQIGEPNFMKITVVIIGSSGSGKTELAKAAGTYVFSDKALNKELVSATGKRSYALKHLARSSGSVCILDDVKNERVRERKNSVSKIVDDYIRSIFQGRMTDVSSINDEPKYLDSCAIITGEYLDTMESQNARILYLQVDDFLKEERNSKALRVLQENPIWLTNVCGGYIKWLLRKIEESSFSSFMKEKLKDIRNNQQFYGYIPNAERLNENCHMIEMASSLAEMFFQDINMSDPFIKQFHKNADLSINAISDSTFILLGGEDAVVEKVLERIFSKCNIRRADYQESCHRILIYQYKQEYFWLNWDEDFLWIESYKKSMLEYGKGKHEEYDEQPYLIIRKERLEHLFETEILSLLQEGKIPSIIADRLQKNLLKKLREMQIIYMKGRSDCQWGRPAVEYPVFEIRTKHSYDNDEDDDSFCNYSNYREETICVVSCEPVIQINTSHPCINALRKQLNNVNATKDSMFENMGEWKIRGMSTEDIYKKRKEFTNSKLLYKE